MHLGVSKTTKAKIEAFGNTLAKCREFVTRYRKSLKAKDVLAQYFPKRLNGFCQTRW